MEYSNTDIKTILTLIAEGHIQVDTGIKLVADACDIDSDKLIVALRTFPRKKTINKPWTAEDEKAVVEMWNEQKSCQEIGDAIGRTGSAVGMRVAFLRRGGAKLVEHESGRRKANA